MTLSITGYKTLQTPRYVLTFFAAMRSVIMLSVTRHNVMAPLNHLIWQKGTNVLAYLSERSTTKTKKPFSNVGTCAVGWSGVRRTELLVLRRRRRRRRWRRCRRRHRRRRQTRRRVTAAAVIGPSFLAASDAPVE
jgi:hypothetical protein